MRAVWSLLLVVLIELNMTSQLKCGKKIAVNCYLLNKMTVVGGFSKQGIREFRHSMSQEKRLGFKTWNIYVAFSLSAVLLYCLKLVSPVCCQGLFRVCNLLLFF